MPSSLFSSFSVSVRRMWRASLMSSVVLFAASSNTLISSQSTWWWWLQACSAMADFSSSPLLVAALCSLMRVSRALFVSPMYTRPQLHRTWYMTLNFFSSRSRSLTCINCPQRVGADRKIVWMLYRLHTRLTSSLRPATYGMKAVARSSSDGYVIAVLRNALWGTRFPPSLLWGILLLLCSCLEQRFVPTSKQKKNASEESWREMGTSKHSWEQPASLVQQRWNHLSNSLQIYTGRDCPASKSVHDYLASTPNYLLLLDQSSILI